MTYEQEKKLRKLAMENISTPGFVEALIKWVNPDELLLILEEFGLVKAVYVKI